MITWVTPSMSNPLADKSVDTRYWNFIFLNSFKICSLFFCEKSPCIISQSYPLILIYSFNFSAFFFELQNIIDIKGLYSSSTNFRVSFLNFSVVWNRICSIFSVTVFSLVTSILTGFCINFFAKSIIGFGMVADNNTICNLSGSLSLSNTISSKKPYSSIWSASSIINLDMCFILILPLLICSNSLPGVATIIWELLTNLFSCFLKSCPPTIFTQLNFLSTFKSSKTFFVWLESSLVGLSMTVWGNLKFSSVIVIIGRRKASVLPVPVWAFAMRFLFFNIIGIASSCICVGVLILNFDNCATSSAFIFKSLNSAISSLFTIHFQ